MERRRRFTSRRLAGLLACAAIPALLATACSSGSGGSGDKNGAGSTASASGSGSATAGPAPAKYKNLPASCKTVTSSTVSALVPKAKSPEGTETKSADISSRSGCYWTGNGKDSFQYRWLAVTLQRFDSTAALGSAEDQARKRYADEVSTLAKAPGFTSTAVSGIGDQADSVSGKATVAKVTSQNDTVVVRAGNVVVIVEYDGAGLEKKKNPSSSTVNSDAQRAAKDAVGSVQAANASLGG